MVPQIHKTLQAQVEDLWFADCMKPQTPRMRASNFPLPEENVLFREVSRLFRAHHTTRIFTEQGGHKNKKEEFYLHARGQRKINFSIARLPQF